MTKREAHAEATRRWSKRGEFGASVELREEPKSWDKPYYVGYSLWTTPRNAEYRSCVSMIIGNGRTWRAAFADADEREAKGLPPLFPPLRVGFLKR